MSEAFDHDAWTEAKAARRAGLVQKKYDAYLDAKEQAEFERLQHEFGTWQDKNWPLQFYDEVAPYQWSFMCVDAAQRHGPSLPSVTTAVSN